jgi:lipoprotein signal peptidase
VADVAIMLGAGILVLEGYRSDNLHRLKRFG